MTHNICIVTGTRAEFGLLTPLIKRTWADTDLALKLVLTGAHLSPLHGNTRDDVLRENFPIAKEIPILLDRDDAQGISDVLATAISSFAAYFLESKPGLVIILGDRYEMLGVAIAALLTKTPIAHLYGGDVTEGAVDEAIRHSITKMSALHFTSCEIYRKRVIQLGEIPENVYNVGSLAVENILTMELMNRQDLSKAIGFSLEEPYALLTFHPATLDPSTPRDQFTQLLMALDRCPDLNIIFTKSNADEGGFLINGMIDEYVARHPRTTVGFHSMGQLKYLSAMKHCELVIGNSSSGIVETPSFAVPTVNIGSRQRGRLQGINTINCEADADAIENAIRKVRTPEFKRVAKDTLNPYGKGDTSVRIVNLIKERMQEGIDLRKPFYDISFEEE